MTSVHTPVTRRQARMADDTPQSNRKRGVEDMDTDENENAMEQKTFSDSKQNGSHSKRKRANWDIKTAPTDQKQLVDAVRGVASANSSAVKGTPRSRLGHSVTKADGSSNEGTFKAPHSANPRRTPRRLLSSATRTDPRRSLRKHAAAIVQAAAQVAAAGTPSFPAPVTRSRAQTPAAGSPRASLQFATPFGMQSGSAISSPGSCMNTPPLIPQDADSDALRSLIEDKEAELVALRERHAALVDEMNRAKEQGMVFGGEDAASLQRQVDEQSESLVMQKAELLQLKERLATGEAQLARLRGDLRTTKRELNDAIKHKNHADEAMNELKQERQEQQEQIVQLRTTIREQCEEIRALKLRAESDAAARRELHNKIQELKGNIRVYCRVRPLTEGDATSDSHGFEFPSEESVRLLSTVKSNIGRGSQLKQHQFDFNRCFGPASTQEDIFNEISGLVQSALDGFNVCVFAYGQTGAGKTFTMEGPNVADCDPFSRGVIPRAVEQIFAYAAEQQQRGWSFVIRASFLEIYQEEVYDLLTSTQSRTKARPHLDIRQQRDGSVVVPGLTIEEVADAEQVQGFLERAAMVRATTATRMNDRSSRSHSVFQMRLEGFNKESGMSTSGVLNMVDLAGSERVSRSGASGEQLKEAKCINQSLTTLGGVIRALAEKSSHIPYRNSKLTRILEPYLGGNSKTLMFVNISPSADDANESLNSLRFAEQVNACHIGKATRQVTA